LKELAVSLREKLPRDTVFIRFDLPWHFEGKDDSPLSLPLPFRRAGTDIQCPDTVLIDLAQPIESIIAGMKAKWRYNAKLALKKGVAIRRFGIEKLQSFYELLEETAERDGIEIHPYNYYKTLFELASTSVGIDVRLYLAEHEGDLLAGIITLFRGNEAVYLYGASSNNKRNFMAPYALQLNAIEDAKKSGCLEYDLFGIPPNDDPSHPMSGLYLFKTGFGGRIIHRYGCWDYPYRLFAYNFFRIVEIRRKKMLNLKKPKHFNK
jgi:lipid II:glycine glycyltransferase (peptidoglycan interpeptide bridge formation enzyme)